MDARFSRVVLVHDWLTGMRGGEKCLERLCRRWPDAPLCTLLHAPGSVSPPIEERRIITSILQRLPGRERYYRYLLPLLPLAARWQLPACDLVVSLSHCVAKAAVPPPGVPHVCYCFTPMRYAWHMRDAYFGRLGRPAGWLAGRLLAGVRAWDRATADRVTHFVAISRTIRDRIRECYGRESVVIYPPVDTDFYRPAPVRREDYYLVVSAFAPYKRIDLAVAACRQLGRKLLVIGTGQDGRRLRALAGRGVTFLGWQSDESIRDHFRRCRALLFPGEEDFGIVPVEAQACGTAVIAFGRGGAAETVVPTDSVAEPTGILFAEQSVDCLVEAIRRFEALAGEFDPTAARRQAEQFHPRRFDDEFTRFLACLPAPPLIRRAA
ncbi:MAG TPA: glycosyltransferase [Gemmataceae bacterium]|jgi:glycosyltransferase involved in cell wall biosynthesis